MVRPGRLSAWFAALIFCGAAQLSAAEPTMLGQWLLDLDHAEYQVRERALERLVAAGPAAIEPLSKQVLSSSAEVSWRASVALERIAVRGDEKTLNQVAAALQKLSTQGKPGLAKLVGEIHTRQKDYRRSRAIASIRSLGGVIGGDDIDAEEELAFALDGPVALAAAEIEVVPEVVEPKAAIKAVPALAEVEVKPAEEKPAAAPAERKIGALELIVKAFMRGEEIEKNLGGDAPPAKAEAIPIAPADPERPPLFELARLEDAPEDDLPVRLPLRGDIEIIEKEPVELPIVEADVVEFAAADFLGPVIIDGEVAEEGEASEPLLELTLNAKWKGGDRGLDALAELPQIYTINVHGAQLTDAALDRIAKLPNLDHMNIQKTPFSSAALWKLRKARPELSLFARGQAMLGVNADLDGPCLINSVIAGSGAQQAGLKEGDEIIAVGGNRIADFSDLTIAIYPHKGGDQIPVQVKRGDKVLETVVTLKPRSE